MKKVKMKKTRSFKFSFGYLAALIVLSSVTFAAPALADCTSPASPEGGLAYFTTDDTYRLCNGSSVWVHVGNGGVSGGGTAAAGPDKSIQFNNASALDGSANLTWANSANFMTSGTVSSSASLTTTGAGARMFYYPRKAAFRAGYVSGTKWNDANIGNYSVALGSDALASGGNSIAIGFDVNATGGNSLAFGASTASSGNVSTAMGAYTTASGDNSTAMGDSTTASGYASMAWGTAYDSTGPIAAATGSTAWGSDTVVNTGGLLGTTWGHYTVVNGPIGTAWGYSSHANGDSSTAWGGDYTISGNPGGVANGPASTAFGTGTTADAYGATAWGVNTMADGEFATAWGGDVSYYGVAGGTASANGATAFGLSSYAGGIGSTAWGYDSNATGEESTAWGGSLNDGMSGGNASGIGSTAWGMQSNATGNSSTAWGGYAGDPGGTASGMGSTAFGMMTISSADLSTSWGLQNTASGMLSTTFGQTNTASGNTATAFGISSTAAGTVSTAWGEGAHAGSYDETSLGRYPLNTAGTSGSWVATDTLFEIGIGANSGARANALTVLKNGNVGIGTATPTTEFMVTGTYGSSNTLSTAGAGTRMFFYPRKAAFRAGSVDGTQWDNGSVGIYSTALGYNATASGDYSTAIFAGTASGFGAVAVGNGATASGNNSVSISQASTALGTMSTAFGYYNHAGTYMESSFGRYSLDTAGNQTSWTDTDTLFEIGNGTGTGTRANAVTVLKNGKLGLITASPSYDLSIDGTSARTIGMERAVTNPGYALTIQAGGAKSGGTSQPGGDLNLSSGVSTGTNSSNISFQVSGANSGTTADNGMTEAFRIRGDAKSLQGFGASASGTFSIGLGWSSTSSGAASTSLGLSTVASGAYSAALGSSSVASGLVSTAFGRKAVAGSGTAADGNGDYSIAVGLQSAGTITTSPKITGDRSMVLFFDSNTNNTNSAYDFTASDKFALIGGEFQIDNQSSTSNKGCIRYDSATTKLQFSHDCSTYTDMGASSGSIFEISSGTVRTVNASAPWNTSNFVFGASQINDTGTTAYDSRMVFEKNLGAFRAGVVTGTQWDAGNMGSYSTAFGYNTLATDSYTFAAGLGTTASGETAVAFGYDTIASNNYSVALGFASQATGVGSFAGGGDGVDAGASASGNSSFAYGMSSSATGDKSAVFGDNVNVSGLGSFGAGTFNAVSGDYSFAVGSGNNVTASYSAAFGEANTTSDALTMVWGTGNNASGYASTAAGNQTSAGGAISTAFGYMSNASGELSMAWGGEITNGYGSGGTASGPASTAFGLNATASGDGATAFGYTSTASGPLSTAWGGEIYGDSGGTAAGTASTAFGIGTHAGSYAETSIGRYAVSGGNPTSWVSTETLFEIGIGADSGNRANAVTVLKNGKVGLLTSLPSYDLSIVGTAARTIGMERAVTNPGYGLTIQAGGAKSGGTSQPGGDLTLNSGLSTGANYSSVILKASGATSGTTADNTLTEILRLRGDYKSIQMGGTTSTGISSVSLGWSGASATGNGSLASGNGAGGTFVASGDSSFAQGRTAGSAGGSATFTSSGTASSAQGYSSGIAGQAASLTASGNGSSTNGMVYANSSTSAMTASGTGAKTWGYVNNASMIASGEGSTAWGEATGSSVIASGIGATAFGRGVYAGSGTAADGNGDYSIAVGLQSASTVGTAPKITGDRSMVLFFDSNTNSTNASYDFTGSDKFALIGGEFQIDNQSSTSNKGCIRYDSSTTKLQYSHDCSTYSDFGGAGASAAGSSYQLQYNSSGSFAASASLNFADAANLMNSGTYGSSATLTTSGAGTRMFFYPRKASFRAGGVSGTQWNDASIGAYSVAMGYNTIANNTYSTAWGNTTTASNIGATAFGYGTTASNVFSTAWGYNTTASGDGATAWGGWSDDGVNGGSATNISSTAFGEDSTASGQASTAFGKYSTASGYAATAFGNSTTASGSDAVAWGGNGDDGGGTAAGTGSTAGGIGAHAGSYGETSFGHYPLSTSGTAGSWVATDTLFEIGNGASSVSRANALTIFKNGNTLFGAATNSPTTTPLYVSLGGTYGTNTIGNAGNLKLKLYDNGTSSSSFGLGISAGLLEVRSGSSAEIGFFPNNGAVEAMRMNTSGYVGILNASPSVALDVTGDIEYSGTITDVSDRRLKKDIKPLDKTDIIDRLNKVDTYSFRMKDDKKGQLEMGVMAQELKEVFPELVRTADDEMGTMSVNYVGFIAPLIEASKDLKSENDTLKAEISALKADQAEMKSAMNEINKNLKGLNVHTGYGIGKAEMGLMMIIAALGTLSGVAFARRRKNGISRD